MASIQTLYILNHSHTDIGFTDYQDVCFRQHEEFIDQALDLIEATRDYPQEARYRWTCETTGPLMRYLGNASSAKLDRFRRLHQEGAIDIAGLQYNFTPLLNVEQMHRSLYPLRALREEFGLTVEAAMQDDVNGISWLFADLLPAVGIEFLTLAINPIRGGAPQPRPGAFWWQGPGGGKVLVWNGYHYLWGRSIAALGDWRFVEKLLPPLLEKLERNPDYPYDFLCCEATHPMRVDNGPPDPRMPNFVRDWNAAGHRPRLAFTTVTEFGRWLRAQHGGNVPTRRGDWTDWWADGVASSAYETGLNRGAHELLLSAEAVSAWLAAQGKDACSPARLAEIYEQVTLYDEHTWGAFSSVAAPYSLFTKAQWNRKASFAYSASLATHDVLARATETVAADHSTAGPEGVFNLGNLDPHDAYPASNAEELFVINPLPWARSVIVEEPEMRGGAAPAGMLDMFFPRDVPWGGNRPPSPRRRVSGEVPALGFAFLKLSGKPGEDDLVAEPHLIENAHYRVRVDTKTGAVAEWFDKDLNHDFAGSYEGWGIGQYVYEWVASELGRDDIFRMDFSLDEFGIGNTDTPFRYATVRDVTIGPAVIREGRASIEVDVHGEGIRWGKCIFGLDSRVKTLFVDWLLYKEHQSEPEAVFIAFPFQLGKPSFRLDLNGIPCTPNEDQLPGAVRDWYPVQRWVDVSDAQRGVTLAPLDAPLIQLGGITTGRWQSQLEPEGPHLMSWAMHNHWMVNFRASQGGEIPLRYRLTTHRGPADDLAADRFGAEAATPALVLRDRLRNGEATGEFLSIPREAPARLSAKPADDGQGIIVRLQNLKATPESVPLSFQGPRPSSVCYTSPIEIDGEALNLTGNLVKVRLRPAAVQSLRVRF